MNDNQDMNQNIEKNTMICDYTTLVDIITRDKATLIGSYSKLIQKSSIAFKCKCGKDETKQFKSLIRVGAFCGTCSRKNGHELKRRKNKEAEAAEAAKAIETITDIVETETIANAGAGVADADDGKSASTSGKKPFIRTFFTKEELDSYMARDKATLISEFTNTFDFKRITVIKFKCNCGKEHEKLFGNLRKGPGAQCGECIKKEQAKKCADTLLKNNPGKDLKQIYNEKRNIGVQTEKRNDKLDKETAIAAAKIQDIELLLKNEMFLAKISELIKNNGK